MLYDLSFLEPSQTWPPKSEGERLKKYEENRKLFKGKHNEVFDDWIRLLREDQKSTLELILNWQKRLSTLWADLLVGEPPGVTTGEEESREQQAVDRLVEDTQLVIESYDAAIDLSRYGDGILKVRYNNRAIIEAISPSIWFPVFSRDSIKQYRFHVLAWSFKVGKEKYLRAEIHEPGLITNRLFLMDGDSIKKEVELKTVEEYREMPQVIETGTEEFLVFPVHNLKTTEDGFGMDDYSDMDSIIQELEVRIAQISRILDKHADPNMYGPADALEEDPANPGKYTFRGGGKYFPVEQEEATPGYVVWEGQLEAAFKEIDVLMEQLYILSETSAAAFGQLKSGLAESGTALRRLMMTPLAKVNRIRLQFDPALKKVLKTAMELEREQGKADAVELTGNINIEWHDGLPDDPKENMEIDSGEYEAGIISLETILRRRGLRGKALQEEIARIQEDRQMNNPLSQAPFSGDNTP